MVLFYHSIDGGFLGVQPNGLPKVDSLLKLFIANGQSGVALFFVISGFLFTWGALRSGAFDWKKFYTNRFLRIFPMYLLILLVVICLSRGAFSFGDFIQNLLGFGNLSNPIGQFDVVLWTISVELQFYMIFPFLVSLLKRQGVKYIYGLIGIMLMIRAIVFLGGGSLHGPICYTMLGRFDVFLIGMALAWHIHKMHWLSTERSQRFGGGVLGAGIIGTLILMTGLFWIYSKLGWQYGETGFNVIWPTLEGAIMASFAVFYTGLMRRYQPRFANVIQFVGMISYSLYLLHYPIVHALGRHIPHLIAGHSLLSGMLWTTFIALPVSLLASFLTYTVIEKPPLQMRKRYSTFSKAASDEGENKQIPALPIPVVSGSDA